MNNLKFGHLISHTFPGFILFFELIGLLICVVPNIDKFWNFIPKETFLGITIFTGIVVVSTILGLIIDCINHFVFDKFITSTPVVYEIHKEIETKEQLDIFRYLIDDQIFYYYECYINIGISLIPGLFIIPYLLQKFLKLGCLGLFVSVGVILFIIIFLFVEGIITYKQSCKYEEEFMESIKKRREEKNSLISHSLKP